MDLYKSVKSYLDIDKIYDISSMQTAAQADLTNERFKKFQEYQKAVVSGNRKEQALRIAGLSPGQAKSIQKNLNLNSPFLYNKRKNTKNTTQSSSLTSKTEIKQENKKEERGLKKIEKDRKGSKRIEKEHYRAGRELTADEVIEDLKRNPI